MPHCLIVGGTGLVGRAMARRLLTSGWAVSLTGRTQTHLPADLAAVLDMRGRRARVPAGR